MTASRKKRDGRSLRLGPLETRVMDVLWDSGPASVRDVIDRLEREAAYTTIATVLTHLADKKLVQGHREGRSVRYRPRVSRREHAAALMEHALSTSDDPAASVLHLVGRLSDEDKHLLRDYLNRDEDAS